MKRPGYRFKKKKKKGKEIPPRAVLTELVMFCEWSGYFLS